MSPCPGLSLVPRPGGVAECARRRAAADPSCAAMHAPLLALAAALWGFGSTGGAPTVTRPFTDCVHSRGDGGFYQGAVDVTESGARCLNWTTVAGFEARHPGRGVGPHNRCRNPDGRIRPWCFFRTPRGRVDWGYCDCKQGNTGRGGYIMHECVRLSVFIASLHNETGPASGSR